MLQSTAQKSAPRALDHHRGLAASLAVGAGLAAPMASDAALVVQNVNQTASNSVVLIDLDQNGTNDFQVAAFQDYAYVFALSKNPWVARTGFSLIRFNAGDSVSASTFGDGSQDAQAYSNTVNTWAFAGDHAYAGVRVAQFDGYHYGWIELTRGSLTVGQVGYQSVANTAAVVPSPTTPGNTAPEPGTLALLALGALGAAATRRRAAEARATA